MEIKEIRELAGILKDSGLTSLEFDDGTSKIKLEKNPSEGCKNVYVNGMTHAEVPQGIPAMPVPQTGAAGSAAAAIGEEIKSPMVGVFYAAASPEEAPFVSVGTRVKQGDVICIVEAMKLMNEIVAERDGEIVEICASNGEIVEYGQLLFRML